MATIEITGLSQAIAGLEELKLSTAKGVLRRVGIAALQPFVAAMEADTPRRTGHLAASETAGSKLSPRQARIAAKEKDALVEVYAGPGPLPQAVQEEFGNIHQAARPFVRPAWAQTKDQVQQRVADGLGAEVKKTAERIARRTAAKAARGT